MCWLQAADRSIKQFYPNKFQPQTLMTARSAVRFPDPMTMPQVSIEADTEGTERIACVASDTDLAQVVPKTLQNSQFAPLAQLRSLEQLKELLASALKNQAHEMKTTQWVVSPAANAGTQTPNTGAEKSNTPAATPARKGATKS
jgi:hypothetical protein